VPIPRPTSSETEQEFIDRCMSDSVMVSEFPDEDQRLAVCTVQNTYGSNVSRVCFQRKPRKKVGRYEVNEKTGTMSDVSLIQIGEAKGHGVWIDAQSLESGLEAIGGSLPAYVTHEGAVDSDRLLKEVGLFSGFYIEDGKLKAEAFKALDSFRVDEPERFRRLFDLAREMPDAFGLSLVFEANLVWIMGGGEEISIEDSDGKGAIRKIPSVRFVSIRSADFVDAPAANKEGLFNSNQKCETAIMEKDNLIELSAEEEIVLDEAISEEEIVLEEPTEVEETEDVDPVAALAAQVAELTAKLEEQAARIEELTSALSDSQSTNQKLSALVKGEEALAEGDGESTPKASVVEEFLSKTGGDQHDFWLKNRTEILRTARK